MNLFFSELVTPPDHLPVEVADADQALAKAIVEQIERSILNRAVVLQTRRITMDGALPVRFELEPARSLTITRWTPSDAAEVIPAASYTFVSRDPQGCFIQANSSWPEPERSLDSFRLTYECGWEVSDTENLVPPSVKLLVERAIEFRAGGAGVGDIRIGGLEMDKPASYQTDRLPPEIAGIGISWAYRPGLFVGRP